MAKKSKYKDGAIEFPKGTIAYYAGFTLFGIYSHEPLQVVYEPDMTTFNSGDWTATDSTIDFRQKLPLGLSNNGTSTAFISLDRREVELFIKGMKAVVDVARKSLFSAENKYG